MNYIKLKGIGDNWLNKAKYAEIEIGGEISTYEHNILVREEETIDFSIQDTTLFEIEILEVNAKSIRFTAGDKHYKLSIGERIDFKLGIVDHKYTRECCCCHCCKCNQ